MNRLDPINCTVWGVTLLLVISLWLFVATALVSLSRVGGLHGCEMLTAGECVAFSQEDQ